MLNHCAANRKRRFSALPNVSPYIYGVKILVLQGVPHIYDIGRLRVKLEKSATETLVMIQKAYGKGCLIEITRV
jgi:hypothetical protein